VSELKDLIARSRWSATHASANGTAKVPPTVADLADIASVVRKNILVMTTAVNSGHPGGSLSATDALVTLYFKYLRYRPSEPAWPSRDRFVMSKAHASPVVYAVLAEAGFFPREELLTFRRIDSRIQGHTHIKTPGVEFSGGSLGQGLSFGLGIALAARLDGAAHRTWVMLGDGECDEGQVWEAAMSAAHYRVDNITAIVDRNNGQNDRHTNEAMGLEPFADKWRAFGWEAIECDGHDIASLAAAYDTALAVKGKPAIVIAKTVKGKGVSFMENNMAFHGKAATMDELRQAFDEIDAAMRRVAV